MDRPFLRRWGPLSARVIAAALVLSLVVGSALWLRLFMDRSSGPQEITVTHAGPDGSFVAVRIERAPGAILPASSFTFEDDEWTPTPNLSIASIDEGSTARYRGTVSAVVPILWSVGPEYGSVALHVGGEHLGVRDLESDEPAVVVEHLTFPLTVRPASWWLLILTVGFAIAPVTAAVVAGRSAVRRHGVVRALGAIAAAAAVGGIAVAVPLLPEPRVARYSAEVVADDGSEGEAQVRLDRAVGDDPHPPLDLGTAHSIVDDWVTVPTARPLQWAGMASPRDAFEVRAEDGPAAVDLVVNGYARAIELDPGDVARLSLAEYRHTLVGSDRALLTASRIGDVVLVTLLLLGVALLVERRRHDATVPVSSRSASDGWAVTAAFAAIPFFAWLIWHLLFWPGPMNPDAMNQWYQLTDTGLHDWHPYVFAVWLGVVRWVAGSPAPAVLAQVLAASVLVGRVAHRRRRDGASMGSVLAPVLLVVVLPASAIHTLTVWKDAPYGLALLGLGIALWRIEATGGRWIDARRNAVLLGVGLTCLWLLRHNGWPVVLGTLLVCAAAYRSRWRRWAAIGGATTAVVLLVNGPLAALLDVRPSEVDGIVAAQHIAMHVNEGTPIEPEEAAVLAELRPLDQEWPYSCHSIQRTWAGPDSLRLRSIREHREELVAIAARLALRAPQAEVDHIRCSSRIVWAPVDDEGGTYFTEWGRQGEHVDYIPRSGRGLEPILEDPPSPRILVAVYELVENGLPAWVVRPAIYLYALLLGCAVAAVRGWGWSALRICAPALIQSATLVPVTLVQDVRLQYGVIMTAIVLLPVLLGPPPARVRRSTVEVRSGAATSARAEPDDQPVVEATTNTD